MGGQRTWREAAAAAGVSNPLRCDGRVARTLDGVLADRFLIHFGAMGGDANGRTYKAVERFLIHFGAMGGRVPIHRRLAFAMFLIHFGAMGGGPRTRPSGVFLSVTLDNSSRDETISFCRQEVLHQYTSQNFTEYSTQFLHPAPFPVSATASRFP